MNSVNFFFIDWATISVSVISYSSEKHGHANFVQGFLHIFSHLITCFTLCFSMEKVVRFNIWWKELLR